MSTTTLHERAEALRHRRVPFVRARVVLAERPTSAKPGDEALVLPDGSIEGFVGGQCAESTVRLQGLSLLESGDSLLLRIAPVPEADQPGKMVVHNPCLSGGTLEIFLEPVLPAPLVAVLGDSPIARAMSTVGAALGYDVRSSDDVDVTSADAVVVASHGKREEETLMAAVHAGVQYIGLIASPKRGSAVLASLELNDEQRAQIHTPAGMNIGARTAAEIALSVFAELIAVRTAHPRSHAMPQTEQPAVAPPTSFIASDINILESDAPSTAIDPVCGMTVFMSPDTQQAEIDGDTVWFCCPGCRREYLKHPEKYPLS